jgi:hypothetical protein
MLQLEQVSFGYQDNIKALRPSDTNYAVENRLSVSPELRWIVNYQGNLRYKSYPLENVIKKNSMVWVRERTIPTERPPLVGEVTANFCG